MQQVETMRHVAWGLLSFESLLMGSRAMENSDSCEWAMLR